jgi:hypothetical protein
MHAAAEVGSLPAGARASASGQGEQTRQPAQTLDGAGAPFAEVVDKAEKGVDVPLDIDVVVDVRFAERVLGGWPEHLADGAGVLQDQGEAGGLAGVRLPNRAVPGAHDEVARAVVLQQVTQKIQTRRNGGIFDRRGQHRHGWNQTGTRFVRAFLSRRSSRMLALYES